MDSAYWVLNSLVEQLFSFAEIQFAFNQLCSNFPFNPSSESHPDAPISWLTSLQCPGNALAVPCVGMGHHKRVPINALCSSVLVIDHVSTRHDVDQGT